MRVLDLPTYECMCLLTGKFCENRVPYCKAGYNYCVNGATCVAMDADYRWVLTAFTVFLIIQKKTVLRASCKSVL